MNLKCMFHVNGKQIHTKGFDMKCKYRILLVHSHIQSPLYISSKITTSLFIYPLEKHMYQYTCYLIVYIHQNNPIFTYQIMQTYLFLFNS